METVQGLSEVKPNQSAVSVGGPPALPIKKDDKQGRFNVAFCSIELIALSFGSSVLGAVGPGGGQSRAII